MARMQEPFPFFVTSFVSLFAILDAVGVIPLFLAVTPDNSERERRAMVTRASIAVLITLGLFSFLGNWIFSFFGVTIAAFRIAGGLILLKVAFDMLEAKDIRSKATPEEVREGAAKQDVAIVPLAIPLLSGPGAISTVIVLAGEAHSNARFVMVLAAIFANTVLVYLILRSGTWIARFLRETGMRIFTRVMGLILGAIAVQFVLTGVKQYLG